MGLRKKKQTRTITVNRSVPTSNYYRPARPAEKRYDFEDKAEKPNKKGLAVSKFINILLFGAGIVLIVFATTLSSSPDIQLKKESIQYYETSVYQNYARQLINQSISNRSKLLFQSNDFEAAMRAKFPEINQIASIVPLGGRDLSVLIAVSDPFAVVSSGSDKGILNTDGIIVSENMVSSSEDLINIRFTSPQENFEVGSRILTADEVKMLNELKTELQTFTLKDGTKLEIEEVLFDVSTGQLEVKLKDKPFYLKLSSFSDANLQVGAVKATLKQLDRDSALPTQYLDVRVPNRVFVI